MGQILKYVKWMSPSNFSCEITYLCKFAASGCHLQRDGQFLTLFSYWAPGGAPKCPIPVTFWNVPRHFSQVYDQVSLNLQAFAIPQI